MTNAIPPRSGIRTAPKTDDPLQLIRKLRAENRELRAENARMRVHLSRSLVDPLTGLVGRRYFDRRLHQEMARADRFEHALSLVVVDVAELRTINERAGHDEGDRVLRWVADVITRNSRDCDVPCFIGEGEFAVILPNTDLSGAHTIVERLSERLRSGSDAPILPGGLPVGLTFGVGSYPEQAETLLELVFEAESSMLEAKSEGPKSERCVVAA